MHVFTSESLPLCGNVSKFVESIGGFTISLPCSCSDLFFSSEENDKKFIQFPIQSLFDSHLFLINRIQKRRRRSNVVSDLQKVVQLSISRQINSSSLHVRRSSVLIRRLSRCDWIRRLRRSSVWNDAKCRRSTVSWTAVRSLSRQGTDNMLPNWITGIVVILMLVLLLLLMLLWRRCRWNYHANRLIRVFRMQILW